MILLSLRDASQFEMLGWLRIIRPSVRGLFERCQFLLRIAGLCLHRGIRGVIESMEFENALKVYLYVECA